MPDGYVGAQSEGGSGHRMSAIAQYFKFDERGTNLATEARAGLTTFLVMAYIIFLNPIILTGGFGDKDAAFTARLPQ